MAKKKLDKEAERTPSSPSKIVAVFKNETIHFVIGLMLVIFSVYLLLAFSSFFFTGAADQSIIDSGNSADLAAVNNNVKNRNAAVYLLNGEQEGVNHGNLLEQAPVKAHMVHEHLMSVMNTVSIFDEYGHHENKPERINRLLSVLTGMEGSYENGGKETK